MKKLWIAFALLSFAIVPVLAQAPPTPDADLQEAEAGDAAATTDPSEPSGESITEPAPAPMSYPSCTLLNGRACSPPGSTTMCQWTEYEPELCVCGSDGSWQCG